jgi:hypothetical protein
MRRLDPRIHHLGRRIFAKKRDCRITPGDDDFNLGRVDGFRKVASGGIPKSVFL